MQILVSNSTVGLANEVYGPSRGKAVRESQSCAAVGVKLLFYRTNFFFVFFLKLRVFFGGANDKSNNPSKAPLQKIKKTTKSN